MARILGTAAGLKPSNLDRYHRIAYLYDLLDSPFEYGRYRRIRPLLFASLGRRILDVGVGTGRNFRFYPPEAKVVGVDLSPAMLLRAERRRKSSPAQVELRQMDVTRLDFPDDTFDAAVASFLFCVLPDKLQPFALRELRRVVKPEGRIRLLDYVAPQGVLRRAVAKLWAPWISWAYGARLNHHVREHVMEAKLEFQSSCTFAGGRIRLLEIRVPDKSVPDGGAAL